MLALRDGYGYKFTSEMSGMREVSYHTNRTGPEKTPLKKNSRLIVTTWAVY